MTSILMLCALTIPTGDAAASASTTKADELQRSIHDAEASIPSATSQSPADTTIPHVIDDLVFSAVLDMWIRLTFRDGGDIEGRILSFNENRIVFRKFGGEIIEIEKIDVEKIHRRYADTVRKQPLIKNAGATNQKSSKANQVTRTATPEKPNTKLAWGNFFIVAGLGAGIAGAAVITNSDWPYNEDAGNSGPKGIVILSAGIAATLTGVLLRSLADKTDEKSTENTAVTLVPLIDTQHRGAALSFTF